MWPRLRAAIIALALVLGAVDGLPLPNPERAARLPPALGQVVDWLVRARATVLAPVLPLRDALMVSERWALFAGASRERFRLYVEGRSAPNGEFRLLYRADDRSHHALADTIEYRRVRGAFNPRTREPPVGYDAFVSFVARRLCEQHARLVEVRVRMEEIQILPDGAGYAGSGRFVHERTRARSEVLR